MQAPASHAAKRPSLTRLVQQIGEIVAQGEDSGSQSQDGGLRARLRTVLLALLDGIVTNNAGQPKEVASMLKLLSITLSRSSTLLSGDGYSILPEVLERLLPLLARPDLAPLQGEAADVICEVLALLHTTAPDLLAALVQGTYTLFEDVCDVASVLSTQPELTAAVSCYAGALRGTDSAEPPLQLRLEGCAACEGVLRGLLAMMTRCLELRPLAFGGGVDAPVLERCRALLLSGRAPLRAGAARFLAAAVAAAPSAPCSPDVLLDTLGLAVQRLAAAPPSEAPEEAEERRGWWRQLLALLTVLLDRTGATPLATPRVHGLCAASLAAPGLPGTLRQPYHLLLRATVAAQPAVLEGSCVSLLRLLAAEEPCCRQLLLQCLELYFRSQQRLCGADAVAAVLAAALRDAGLAPQADTAAGGGREGEGEEEKEEEGGRSARKRRRVRITPPRPARPAEPAAAEAEGPAAAQAPGAGLRAAAAAVARLAGELRERCLRQQPGVVGALGLACLLGLLAPLAPREALALALPALLPALHPPAGSSGGSGSGPRASMGSEGERLGAAVRLAQATLQAALVGGAAGAAPACLLELPSPHLLSLLQRGVQGERAGAAAAAGGSQVAALCASLTALQAELLDPGDVLELLRTALDDRQAGGGGGATVPDAVLAAAALLPAAACIGGGKERLLGSQPRATQGGRRAKGGPAAPAPLVAALLQLLSEPGRRTPQQHGALLAAAAQGLCCVVAHAHDHAELALSAAELAGSLCRDGDAGAYAVCRMLLRGGGGAGYPGFQPTLPAAVSEWAHQALERLTAAELAPAGQAAGVDAVAGFLRAAAPAQLERSRPLARWLLRCAGGPHGAVRGAVLRHAGLLAEPQGVLALCHEGEQPTHSKDRLALVEACEPQVLQALREALEAAAGAGSGGRGGSGAEAAREGLAQLVACVGARMRSHPAHQLLLGILAMQLDHREPGLRMLAAEALLGFAEQRGASLRDTLFASPKLVAFLARQLPARPGLAAELAELLDCSLRTLTLALVPQALPILVAEDNRQGLELLAAQAGMEARRLVREHGHCVVARELFQGSASFGAFISVLEDVTGEDFVLFLYSTMTRTISEIMSEAGSAEDWGGGTALPDSVLSRASATLHNLSQVAHSEQQLSVADFLAEGDHVTRMLKEWGDALESRLPPPHRQAAAAAAAAAAAVEGGGPGAAPPPPAAAPMSGADVRGCVCVLRCVLLLASLAGRFVARFLPQFMVLLAAGLRPANPREVKLQCLEGWLGLVRALAAEAPVQLGGVVNQVVVAVMAALQEGGAVTAAAARVVEEVAAVCRRSHRAKLRLIPPLPNWLPELERLNESLAKERGKLSSQEQLELLVGSLGDESMTLRATALRELRNLLGSRREWLLGLLGGGDGGGGAADEAAAALLSRLMSALLKCCEPDVASTVSAAAQQACAQCLGMLGAVDPSRLQIDMPPPAARCTSDGELLVRLISRHLVRLLKAAPSLQVLDAATISIQELLRHHSRADGLAALAAAASGQPEGASGEGAARGSRESTPAAAEGNLLFAALAPEVQAIVRPYLDSKYSLRGIVTRPPGTLFTPATSFRKWLFLWLSQLVHHHARGDHLGLFQSVIPVFRFDVPTCLFLMPYLVHHVLAQGSQAAAAGVQAEIQAVLAGASASREGTLCCQAVFGLLDTLQKWLADAKAVVQQQLASYQADKAANRPTSVETPPVLAAEWVCLAELLDAMPKQLLAQAATQCGAHARSLLYFEAHVRGLHGGALNPAAHRSAAYDDAEVSYLQEVYGRLEEPDGLQGLMRLRQGGPLPEDQRLAAEKAGNWSEALTLYEQALQHSGHSGHGGGGAGAAASLAAAAAAAGAGAARAEEADDAGLGALQRGYLQCLLQMGHLRGLLAQLEGLAAAAGPRAAPQLAALGAAASWRLGRWEAVEGYVDAANCGFAQLDVDARWEVRIAMLLWAVARRDLGGLRRGLEVARAEVMGPFSAAAMESYSRAYPHLVKLHILQEIDDAAGSLQRSEGPLERQRSLRWEERLRATQSSLGTQEPILALRRQLASLSGAAAEAGECWLQLAKLCRSTGHYEAATTAVLEAVASRVPSAPLEHLRLLWDQGQPYRAVSEAQLLARQARDTALAAPFARGADHARFHAAVALQLARWMAETGQAAKDDIVELFERAASLEPKSEEVLFRFAVYLDEVMSDAKRRQEVDRERGSARGMDRLQGQARIKLGEDKPYLEFLPDVLRGYGLSLTFGAAHATQSLPRLLTLWFDFGTYLHSVRGAKAGTALAEERGAAAAAAAKVQEAMAMVAKKVPMSTWLAALPQLISRMCHPCKEVSETAKQVIVNITQYYPHQSLWSLAAVSKSGVAARRAAAGAITNAAKKSTDHAMFAEINGFCDQLIRLAAHQPAGKGRTMSARKEFNHLVRSMPLRHTIMPAMSCLSVALPAARAAEPEARRGGRAASPRPPPQELVTVEGLVDSIEVMHSLQRPKKVTLLGSDGRRYTFLAKPKDDLRKDNRLMEAAGVLNRLFVSHPAARRRNLYLRRFAVLPIGEDNGIVEWVPHTAGLRHCLNNTYAAAGLYEGNSTNRKVQRIWDAAPPSKRRGEVLDELLAQFPPLFHRWLLATFPEPAAWLTARLAYSRTAAVWSMVGHVVGLGDRHGENILLDCHSGDVVHVDFSCLFDKGLTLAKPEMVPFRLTQNVIDGFGVSGVEGVFRRVCEITLSVLRQHQGSILSVMDTFVHDPLVDWVKGPGGGRASGDEGCDNPYAKDALATIEGRLKGTLLGVSSKPCMPLSAEGHAHRLIEEATDKDNLGMMYIWWMPWM